MFNYRVRQMQIALREKLSFIKIGSFIFIIGGGYVVTRCLKFPAQNDYPLINHSYIHIQPSLNDIDSCDEQFKKACTYLHLSKSKHPTLNEYGVKRLAKIVNLSGNFYYTIKLFKNFPLYHIDHHAASLAKNLDFKSSVKLAEIGSVDLRLFLPPLNVHQRKNDICSIIESLYNDINLQECYRFYVDIAMKEKEKWRLIKHRLQQETREKYFSEKKFHLLILKALIKYSHTGKDACKIMTDNGIFGLLHTLREKYEDDEKFINLIAELLSNLSQYPFSHEHFYMTGWIGILCKWKNVKKLELNLYSAKILFNLNNSELVLSDSMFILYPFNSKTKFKYDIIFFHGLMGSVFRTWRQSDNQSHKKDYTRCWPWWLTDDLANLRLLAVEYETSLSNRKFDCYPEKRTLQERSETILKQLLAIGVGKRPIIFIGHSMGGLLIKNILVNCSQSNDPDLNRLLEKVKGIIFYTVPHRGSFISEFASKFGQLSFISQEVKQLAKDSPYLLDLHKKFIDLSTIYNIKCLSFGEKYKSRVGIKNIKFKAKLVDKESSDTGIGEFILLETDHFNTCKPEDKTSVSYVLTKDFIKHIFDKEEKGKLSQLLAFIKKV